MQMFPTRIHYHKDHSSPLPLLVYNLPLATPTLGNLAPESTTQSLLSSNTHTPSGLNRESWKTASSARVQCLRSFICLSSFRLYSFPKLLKSKPFSPTHFSEVVSYIWNIDRFVIICVPSWNAPPLLIFLKNMHTLSFTMCCKVLWVLTNSYFHVCTIEVSCRTISPCFKKHTKNPVLHLSNLPHTLKKPSALKYIYMFFKVFLYPLPHLICKASLWAGKSRRIIPTLWRRRLRLGSMNRFAFGHRASECRL